MTTTLDDTPVVRLCRGCNKPLPTRRGKHAVWCRDQCKRDFYRRQNPKPTLPTGTVGTISEILVATDLLKRGYDVFRAMSPAATCDLAILRNKQLLKVEVKTGKRGTNRVYYPAPRGDKALRYDILAVVVDTDILYLPELPDTESATDGL